MSRPGLWLCLGLLAACGQKAAPEQTQTQAQAQTGTAAAPVALPVAPAGGRLVVAEVNGAPVYEDCVATQAAAGGLDRRAARDECIAIELLAQEAERRGLAAHPEVRRAQKNESVRRLIDLEFLSRYRDPSSVPRAQLEAVRRELLLRYEHPEYRETTYVRVPLPEKDHPPGSPADAEGQGLMERVHAKLAGRRDLKTEDLKQAMVDVLGDRRWETAAVHPIHRHDRIVEPYLAATFAIPEPGLVSPPFRTEWGWDIVLLQTIHPAINRSVDDARDELFEILRRRLFQQWIASLRERARTEIHEDALARLQEAEEQARFAEPAGAATDAPAGQPAIPGAPAEPPGGSP